MQGAAEARNGQPGEALLSWRRGQRTCEAFGHEPRWRAITARIINLLDEAGMKVEAAAARRMLAAGMPLTRAQA